MRGTRVQQRLSTRLTKWRGRLWRPTARRGQGIVEFALAMPLLLIILLGTIDMGRMFFEYIELRGAVREGVAAAARATCTSANTIARNAVLAHSDDLDDGGTAVSSVTYSPTCPTSYDDPAATISLEASRNFQPVFTKFLQIYFGMDGSVHLSATASAKVWT